MDALAVLRAGDRSASALLAAIAAAVDERPLVVHSGVEAELALRSRIYDLLVIDPDVTGTGAALPGGAGDEVPPAVAWLMVRSSSRVAELLDAGVEDVVDASMAEVELAARLRRVLRHHEAPLMPRPVGFAGIEVDARLRQVTWEGIPLALTPREIEVLQVLVAAGGNTVARGVIYRQVWRWAMPRGDRTVDVNVKRLRDKLGAASVPVQIVTRPGVGYRLHASVDVEPPVVTGL